MTDHPALGEDAARLAALARYDILDTPAEQGYDDIVALARQICETPVALISFVADDRQWFKARVGFDACETPMEQSVCRHGLKQPGLLVIPDLTRDPRTRDNPLVTADPNIRFYAGARLAGADGVGVGMLCVIDVAPRPEGLTEAQGDALLTLARQVMTQLELRSALAVGELAAISQSRREAELRESETRYRTLFEAIDAGFCVIEMVYDADGRPIDYIFVEANPAFERQVGFENAIGRRMREIIPNHEQYWFDIYGEVARTGEPVQFQQGSAALGRWFVLHAFRVGAPERQRVAVLFTNITERRKAELALLELNTTLEARVEERAAERDRLWRLSEDMLARADYSGMMSAVSPAWTRVLGWSDTELLSRGYATFMHPDDGPPTLAAIGAMQATGQPARFENRIATADGGYKPIEWTVAPEPDGVNFIAVGRDLSAVKAREAELRDLEDTLRQSQKMEAVGQLTGGLAHDFNNLLAGISGSLELIQTRLAQGRLPDVDRYVTAAQGASRRAAALTHRLLAFSRRQTLAPKVTSVNTLVAGMEDLITRTVGPGITVETVAAGGLWPVRVDPNQLENALLNLCINARDAMPDGGRLVIETANRWLDERAARERDLPPGQYVSLCVSDNGAGMTPDVVAKAFDPFFTTKPIGMGTGLGLSMIYGFARQSGGQVRIYSEPAQGTMVCVYLPRHLGESEPVESEPRPTAHAAGAGETVLVVDDEPLVRMLIVEVLEEFGYAALEAADGAAALSFLQSDARIDLVITDVGLPNGMNGRQVADAARVLRPELKVLFITGFAENAVLNHGHLDAGMAIMTKPFEVRDLGRRVQEMLPVPQPSEGDGQ